MRIIRSASYRFTRATTATLKKTTIGVALVALLAGGVLVNQNILHHPQAAYATTPPDSCFAFTAGTITDYYDNEGNNGANPACPRAVDIPATIGGTAVTSIGDLAFMDNQLTSVTIPNGVTTIGHAAFFRNLLTNVTIPISVTNFSNQVFSYNKFTTLPDYFSQPSTTSIPDNMFAYNQFTTLTIPSNIQTIEGGAFSGNTLITVTIPNSVTNISSYAFHSNQLTSVTIPNSVTTLGTDIFLSNPVTSITYGSTTYTDSIPLVDQCYTFDVGTGTIFDYKQYDMNLIKDSGIACMKRDVIIPATIGGTAVASIGSHAFSSNQLTSITIPNSVTSIGMGAFYINQISSLTLPDSVTSLGAYAFEANQLTSVTLGCGMSALGQEAFAINKLTDVTIPNCITAIDPTAFFGQNPWGGVVEDGSDPAHDWYSSDPAVRQAVYDSLWYTQLITEDPANPNGLTSDSSIDEDYWIGDDANGNGLLNDSLGGHIINPASVTLRYVSSTTGQEIQASTVKVSDVHTDYRVTSNPTGNFASNQYYFKGDSKTFTPPTVTGYLTPAAQTTTLVAGNNTITFTYAPIITDVPFATTTVTNNTTTNTPPASLPAHTSPLLTQSRLSMSPTGDCTTVQAADLLSPAAIAQPDGITLLGGVDFTLNCSSGGTTTIAYTLGAQVDTTRLRVYKYTTATSTLTDITNDVTITSTGGVPTISYALIDGSDYDEDGLANGVIVDPLYVGLTEIASTSTESLAATGVHSWLGVASGLVLFIAGTLMMRKHFCERKRFVV